ncbi:MAG: cysteine desulfurase family protein [Bacteroidales bacterium]
MIYFDNAATTPLLPEVKEAMKEAMELFGNPTSIHGAGRKSRVFIEDLRALAARLLNVNTGEVFFTSGGTESLQTSLTGAVRDLGVRRIITSPLEHHAVLHNIEALGAIYGVHLVHVDFDHQGRINLDHLEELLQGSENTMVVLMHANNETGMLLPLKRTATLCRSYGALFLADTVQTIGKYRIDLSEGVSFAAASAHKFHGPKGTGLLFVSGDNVIKPLILGGGQERNMRSGTENIIGIAGMVKALEIAHRDAEAVQIGIGKLRNRMISGIRELVPEALILTDPEHSLHTILNVGFPVERMGEMLVYRFDMAGIAVSGGSACASGVNNPSHVLLALGASPEREHVRFSFSRINTEEEVEHCLDIMAGMLS